MVTVESLPVGVTFGLTGNLEVMQNVRILLTTRRGTVPMDRDFGISQEFLDSPVNVTRAKAEQEIFLQMKKYEPRAILRQIKWDANVIDGKIWPTVKVEVNLNGV